MRTRRRVLAVCGAGLSATAGCLTRTGPDIPREARILDARASIEAGGYQTWDLAERVGAASLGPVDGRYVFSYEFTVQRGPDVTLAVTGPESLERRAETGGQYRVFLGTRSHGQQGHASESMPAGLLDVLVADTRHVGPGTPRPGRGAARVHVQAYLARPGGG